jgi:hypothetical protein
MIPRRKTILAKHFVTSVLTIAACAAIITDALLHSRRAQAQTSQDDRESRIERRFQIAPVPLNLAKKNGALVGLDSYWVNAVWTCDDRHSAGPQTRFLPGGNPYFGQPKTINRATYLGGGRDFE